MELQRIEWERKGEIKGVIKGEIKGIIKGEIKGKQADILVLLEDLGTIPDSVQAFIHEQKNLDILSRWLKLAAKSSSFEEFEKEIQKDFKSTSVTP